MICDDPYELILIWTLIETMKKAALYLSLLAALSVLGSPVKGSANIGTPLLVGEWSEPDKCSNSRTVFTQNGQYFWVQKISGTWENSYEGIYVPMERELLSELQAGSPEVLNAVIVADGPNMGGAVMEVHDIAQDEFRGMWNVKWSEGLSFENPNDAFFSFVKCPER